MTAREGADGDEQDPEQRDRDQQTERDMATADAASGEGDAANDTEARYDGGESPA